jgi:phosphoglycerate dehydrogenase-like enzyme
MAASVDGRGPAERRPRLVVLAPEPLFRSFFDAPRRRRLSRLSRWTRVEGRRVTPRMRAALRDADALLTTWDSPRFGEELLARAPRLRLVAHCGGEVKGRFARPLFERLVIANAPGPMAAYVAELAVAFLLIAARRIDDYREALRAPSRRVYARLHALGADGESLRQRTVGLLGFGRIGRETARLLGPFGARVVAHDPFADAGAAQALGVTLVPFRRLLARSDHLVIAAGVTETTRGLVGRDALALLRDGATVVNVARGAIVDLDALVREVRKGRLRCALDVTDPLEPLPPRHPLRRLRGAIVTPHVGAAMLEVRRAMADTLLDAVERFFAGRPVPTRVTAAMLETMT